MAQVHGSKTVVILDGDDLTEYTDNSSMDRSTETHRVTTYGNTSHRYGPGLKDGTASISGVYDSTTGTGPRAVILPLLGTTVTFVRQPEGTGAGLPQDSVSVIVTRYQESAPVADFVRWSCDMQLDGDVDSTPQES